MQLLLDLVQQVERIHTVTIHLIDENDHRRLAHTADLHQLTGLCLHTFGNVDHDNDAIHRRQGAEGILREVLVTRCIQDVNLMIRVIKRHHRSSDGDTTLFLNLHPVGCGGFLDLVRLHRACHVDRATKQQELLGQRCFTRIRVTDNCECSSSTNLC